LGNFFFCLFETWERAIEEVPKEKESWVPLVSVGQSVQKSKRPKRQSKKNQ